MTVEPLHGMRVLVVEDEFYMADDLVRALECAGATPVGPFGSVRQAQDAVARNGIDAAVLDLNLHGTRSDDLAKQLNDAKVPILIVSGYSVEALPPELRHLKRLEKPINCGAIISALSEQVESAP
ncbi:MAG TPA: response regulator [Sphingomicrobium sp.]